ncbi:MAG TPA: hypothetical protein VFV50_16060 [Bdellovibrionales bacterium]|nr:hypothetical protein [Bdellovibrionales bacterium]
MAPKSESKSESQNKKSQHQGSESKSGSTGSTGAGSDIGNMTMNEAIENPQQLMDIAGEFLNKAATYLEREVRANPYQVLGAAASFGYLLGQGWMRALTKVGMAFVAQEAARRTMPGMATGFFGKGKSQSTVH